MPATLRYRHRRLRVLRLEAGMTQAAIAKLSGIKQPLVSQAERGAASKRVLEALGRVLGADPETLLDVCEFAVATVTPPPRLGLIPDQEQ